MAGQLKDIFLELFEAELKNFKQLNWDHLVGDITSLLLPVATTTRSGIPLAKRIPYGEAEKIQKAVLVFLVLREFHYTILRIKDDRLPLKEDFLFVKVKDTYELEQGKEHK